MFTRSEYIVIVTGLLLGVGIISALDEVSPDGGRPCGRGRGTDD